MDHCFMLEELSHGILATFKITFKLKENLKIVVH